LVNVRLMRPKSGFGSDHVMPRTSNGAADFLYDSALPEMTEGTPVGSLMAANTARDTLYGAPPSKLRKP